MHAMKSYILLPITVCYSSYNALKEIVIEFIYVCIFSSNDSTLLLSITSQEVSLGKKIDYSNLGGIRAE